MNSSILKISFSRLRKQEIKTLASKVITVVDGYDPETLGIKEIYDLLVELKPQIKSLGLEHLAHPISAELNELRRQRIAFAQGVVDRIKTVENGRMSGMEASLKIAKPIVLHHLKGLRAYDDIKSYENINSFFELFDKSASLQTAIQDLDLTSYLDNLLAVNVMIDEQFNARTKSISERPKAITPSIAAAIKTALENLFKQIEVAQIKNQELDYTPLIDELNEHLAILKARLKARASYYKNKAENALNDNEVVEDDEVVVEGDPEEPSESTYTTERIYPMMSVEADDEDDLGQLDKKKTVAVSTKQTRLPNVSNEA